MEVVVCPSRPPTMLLGAPTPSTPRGTRPITTYLAFLDTAVDGNVNVPLRRSPQRPSPPPRSAGPIAEIVLGRISFGHWRHQPRDEHRRPHYGYRTPTQFFPEDNSPDQRSSAPPPGDGIDRPDVGRRHPKIPRTQPRRGSLPVHSPVAQDRPTEQIGYQGLATVSRRYTGPSSDQTLWQ